MSAPSRYNLGTDRGMDTGQLWDGNTVNIGGQQYIVRNNGDNTVSFQPMSSATGGTSSDEISRMQGEIDRINREAEQARRRDEVRGETESYLRSKQDSLGDIQSQMDSQRNALTSQLSNIYSEIDKAVQDKNFELAQELESEAGNMAFELEKYDSQARQQSEQIKAQNFNNARAANRTDTSLMSNLMSEPSASTADVLYGIGDTRRQKEDLIGQRGQDVSSDLMSRLNEVLESKNQYADQLGGYFEPVNTQMNIFKNQNYGNFLQNEYDANPNRQAIDNSFSQIQNLLNSQTQAANVIPDQFRQQHHGVGSDVVAVDDSLRNTLDDNSQIQESLSAITPSSLPMTSNYEGMVEQLGMQRQAPNDKDKRYASSLNRLFNKGAV